MTDDDPTMDDGLPIGSPAWLARQSARERASGTALTKPVGPVAQIAGGVVLVAIGVAMTIFLLGDHSDSLFVVTPFGRLVLQVIPIVAGIALVVDGLRRRRG